ncbi:SNF1-interacting protein [Plenodomus lingam]|uniref:Similar to protein SIP5 n=1 Tax=Leptosphaeria maculans (strain JN3 / isolate v23.1.3 / race Av1-4-5-6-7-8) TaxID=985895 RepID=E5A926_LEPMJ|nr:similar to protein SIP5 [Plenodomus lingam JN3]KAH9877321.1 SNF1-interacting protein [Plenodomus lingam]CBY00121.1 similar to protein SIP5 [Plenodomus lingam JN3]
MGNSQGKEALPAARGHARRSSSGLATSPTTAGPAGSSHERTGSGIYSSRNGRGSRPDLSFLGIRSVETAERDPALEPRRETKAEREARKLEKERIIRAQEREKSLREEGVDGGFLVTLGVYTGPEDFSKPTVRQLQIERRLAPFWKGLDDHEDTWTEHQLVAVVKGLPLPAADEIPPEEPPRPANHLSPVWNPRGSESNLNSLTVPMGSRSMSQNSDRSNLSPSNPTFSLPSPISPISPNSNSGGTFRGRAKTLASLATGSRNASQTEVGPQEMKLPQDPYVNGQRVEAFLYKNAAECPICFMFYPPHLNKTRCCDQSICSECFVQIKRPDPHTPEHHGDAEATPAEPEEEINLVSEPATCPFCKMPEFGVTYEAPPFRRGLVYSFQGQGPLSSPTSAMSSTTSLNSPNSAPTGRRRATSLAVNDKAVVTTDMVRPDWAKKLADARAHALRRAAAATALHNAAYMMGSAQQQESRFAIGRRRRMFGTDSAGSSGVGTPRREGEASSGRATESMGDLFPARLSSRRGNRIEDLEELMMMEAIRLSLAAEEDRKRRDEKEAAKEAKKEGKKKAKENRKFARAQRHIESGFHPIDVDGLEEGGAGSSSAGGKGKEIDRSGGSANTSQSADSAQRHLEDSRAHFHREASGTGQSAAFDPRSTELPSHRSALRNLSEGSSSASSFAESFQNSLRNDSNNLAPGSSYGHSPNTSGLSLSQGEPTQNDTPGTEPMFNFKSLAEAISPEDKTKDAEPQYIEDVAENQPTRLSGKAPELTLNLDPTIREPLGESLMTLRPEEAAAQIPESQPQPQPQSHSRLHHEDGADISPAPHVHLVTDDHSHHSDQKHIGELSVNTLSQEAT